MGIAGVDTHKISCYGIIEEESKIISEREFPNTREGWRKFLAERPGLRVVIEANSLSEPVYRILEELGTNFKVANPHKVRVIAEASIKTDRIDAKRLVELERAGLIPESWVPPREIRDLRHLARYRAFLVRIRTRIKNRLHVELAREEANSDLTYRYLESVKDKSMMIHQLYRSLKETNQKIREVEKLIDAKYENREETKILDTIPGAGKYSSLLLYAEIGDIDRFSQSGKLASYAGLVPRTHQSGTKLWQGSITKEGNKWLRWCLEECIRTHIYQCPGSPISQYYQKLKREKGSRKAAVAASRRLLCVIYHMLKEKITFQAYMQGNVLNPSSNILQK